MKIFWLIVGFVALMGFSAYAAFGETGPIGWINAGQVAVFGSYSPKISAFVLMAVVALPVVVIWAMVAPASLQGNAQKLGTAIDTPVRPYLTIKSVLAGWVVFVAVVWAAAYGYAAWQQHTQSSGASAAYAPLELVPGMKDAAAGHDHLAVRGRLLGDHVVARKKGSSGSEATMLVPVVERGWREGDPVHFVVRLGADGDSTLRSVMQRPSESLLVRTDGSVPTLARQVFDRMRAPLADDAVALVLVAAQGGLPATPTAEAGGGGVVMWGTIGTGIVTMIFLMIGGALLGVARQERKQAAKALEQAGR